MKHIKQISLFSDDPGRDITPLEQLILLTISVYFSDWPNFAPVIQNLQKFYAKT